jgi:hypothetical protein
LITLDTDFTLPSSFNYLLAKVRRKYNRSNQAIDKYTEAYASQGTPQTNKSYQAEQALNSDEINQSSQTGQTNCVQKDNLDYDQLIKDLKLNVAENRYALLMLIPRPELMKMLRLLGKDKLLYGLKFFSKEMIMKFIYHLPKTDILKMLFTLFTDKKQILEFFPIKELNNFMLSDKVEKGHLIKTFELMPRETLASIAGTITGEDYSHASKSDLMNKLSMFKKQKLVNGIKKLDYKSKLNLITNLTESFPNLYQEFSRIALCQVCDRFAKIDLIDSMKVLEDKKIFEMLGVLPDKLLAVVVSQIDPEVFASLLLRDYKDLLANLVLGKAAAR